MIQEKLDSAKNLLFIALAIDMAVTALVVITDLWAVGVLNDIRGGVTKADQSTIGSLEFWESFSKVMILTLIGVGLALVRWLDACYEYAKEALKATGFDQERWKTWGWMVPFMNLFKPYQVLAEIYRAGANDYLGGENWKKSAGSGMLLVWWILWVIAHMVMGGIGKLALKYSFKDDLTLSQIIGMYYVSVTVCVISLIVAGLWFVVAGSLTRRLLNRSVPAIGSSTLAHFPAMNEAADSTAPNFTKTNSSDNFAKRPPQTVVDEDHVYAEIAKELETGVADKGLWTRLFAECGGDEKQTKVLYIKVRAERLISSERLRLEHASMARDTTNDTQGILKCEADMRQVKSDSDKIDEVIYALRTRNSTSVGYVNEETASIENDSASSLTHPANSMPSDRVDKNHTETNPSDVAIRMAVYLRHYGVQEITLLDRDAYLRGLIYEFVYKTANYMGMDFEFLLKSVISKLARSDVAGNVLIERLKNGENGEVYYNAQKFLKGKFESTRHFKEFVK